MIDGYNCPKLVESQATKDYIICQRETDHHKCDNHSLGPCFLVDGDEQSCGPKGRDEIPSEPSKSRGHQGEVLLCQTKLLESIKV